MTNGYNEFAQQNGASALHLDENLVMEKENRKEIVWWGSVYGSDFFEMPDNAPTSEAAYRTWCWKNTGMMPRKRTPAVFDDYIRPRMLQATVRESAAGTEFGVEVEDTIESVLSFYVKRGSPEGSVAWIDTVDEKRGLEVIIKIKGLMEKINMRQSEGTTEGKIKRRDIIERLLHYGRQVAGRDGSVNRLRCTYALPIEFADGGFDALVNTQKHNGPGRSGV